MSLTEEKMLPRMEFTREKSHPWVINKIYIDILLNIVLNIINKLKNKSKNTTLSVNLFHY